MERLQDCDVCASSSFVESSIYPPVVELAKVNGQVEMDVRESLLPLIADALALLAVVSTPCDLQRSAAVACCGLGGGIDFVERSGLKRYVWLPLGNYVFEEQR